ncbi:hypothetical protein BH10PSE7_BH10PSE7_29740 [soil metagenome]
MILLAFDTAMAACSAAVYDSSRGEILAQASARMDRGHADALAPMIRDVMLQAGAAFGDLARIGVTIGPGSFTGVRTGIAMARGFGVALNVPIAGIDTLTAIAQNAPKGEHPIAVAADARKDELYVACLAAGGTLLMPPAVLTAEVALARLPNEPSILLGTGAAALMAAAPNRFLRRNDGDLPDAARFAPFCANLPLAGQPEPLYLRTIDAKPQGLLARRAAPMTIRAGAAADATLLGALHAECFDNPWSAADIAGLMAMPGASSLIAMNGDEPAAFLLARRAADETEILAIGTRPFARRRGFARALLNHLGADAPGSIFIEVAEHNRAARALYATLGFVQAGLRKAYYEHANGGRENAYVMRKDQRS